MLLLIFVGSVVAAVAVVAYSYQVLFSGWARGHKRGMVYAPPPLPPPPPNVQAMLAAVSLPAASPNKLATGSGAQPTVGALANAPLPERFFPPLVKQHAAPAAPRRQARGSMPPPLPPRVTGEATIIVADDITGVELASHSHS